MKSIEDSIKLITDELKNIENIAEQRMIVDSDLIDEVERKYHFLRDNILVLEIDFSLIYKLVKKNNISSKSGLMFYNSKVGKKRQLSIEKWNKLIDALGYKKIEVEENE